MKGHFRLAPDQTGVARIGGEMDVVARWIERPGEGHRPANVGEGYRP
jgi:hypothetical protein